jgi:hypothetical protein
VDVSGTIVYEVNLDVDASIETEYRAWLRAHVDEILALPGFIGATVFDVVDPKPAPGRIGICTHYRLADEASLLAYFEQHAPRLRADGVARFGDRFTASRRVLQVQPIPG